MIFNEQHLWIISLSLSALCGLLAFFLANRETALRNAFNAFPRNRVLGLVLAAIALMWSAYLVDQMTLGDLSHYKWLLYIITPVTFYMVMQYLDELLAARALGGLLMLIPTVMVDAARWHPSSWRLVVVVLAYVMVIAGIWLVLCPFKFRIWTTWWLSSAKRRNIGAAGAAGAAALLLIAGIVTR